MSIDVTCIKWIARMHNYRRLGWFDIQQLAKSTAFWTMAVFSMSLGAILMAASVMSSSFEWLWRTFNFCQPKKRSVSYSSSFSCVLTKLFQIIYDKTVVFKM